MKQMAENKLTAIFLAVVVLLMLPEFLFAHHNHQAMTNYNYLLGVTGVVTQHEFVNPHVMIHVTATDTSGNAEEWIGYGANPGVESRVGYSAHMFKVGEEKITMYGFPQKDGRKIMVYVKLVRANGEDIPMSQTPTNDLDAFMTQHNVQTFKEIPETLKRYIGGAPFLANDDK